MGPDPASDRPLTVDGFLFREYFIGRFSIGGDGLGGNYTPLPHARITFGKSRLEVEIVLGTVKAAANPWATGGSWSYHEFEQAQVFEAPYWATRRRLPHEEYPLGVRIHLGESRSALLFFTTDLNAVLDALEGHRVKVGRTPIKLSPLLIGRK